MRGFGNTNKKRLDNPQFVKNLEINIEDSTITFDCLLPEDLAGSNGNFQRLVIPIITDANSFDKKKKSYVSCALK